MRFEFTDDQLAFRDTLRAFLDEACPPSAVRAAWDDDAVPSRDRWAALGGMGVIGMLLPDARGGMGLTEVDLILLLEECGRAAVPEPVTDTAAVTGPLLAEAASDEFADEWLGRIADGAAVVVVQKGGKAYITDADVADLVVLVHEDEVYAVPPDRLTLERQRSVDGSRRLFSVDWHRDPAYLVASGERGWRAVNRGFDRGVLGTAAELVGLADRMISLTVDYVSERHQFGVPVGSFQAVKHQLADAFLGLELARPVLYRAAWSMATDSPDRSRDVSMAKVYAADAARVAGRVALQCHGAIGYTVEYDLHLYLKRAWALQAAWGDPRWHRRRVATSVLAGRSAGAPADGEPVPLGETLA